mmetsp:Transcript_24509/g.67860  ORF Transcript_24509/g.67860 Transcript_24509/m.67860 type:complete len:229 (+) Transcript_24509:869-1555(+)
MKGAFFVAVGKIHIRIMAHQEFGNAKVSRKDCPVEWGISVFPLDIYVGMGLLHKELYNFQVSPGVIVIVIFAGSMEWGISQVIGKVDIGQTLLHQELDNFLPTLVKVNGHVKRRIPVVVGILGVHPLCVLVENTLDSTKITLAHSIAYVVWIVVVIILAAHGGEDMFYGTRVAICLMVRVLRNLFWLRNSRWGGLSDKLCFFFFFFFFPQQHGVVVRRQVCVEFPTVV